MQQQNANARAKGNALNRCLQEENCQVIGWLIWMSKLLCPTYVSNCNHDGRYCFKEFCELPAFNPLPSMFRLSRCSKVPKPAGIAPLQQHSPLAIESGWKRSCKAAKWVQQANRRSGWAGLFWLQILML